MRWQRELFWLLLVYQFCACMQGCTAVYCCADCVCCGRMQILQMQLNYDVQDNMLRVAVPTYMLAILASAGRVLQSAAAQETPEDRVALISTAEELGQALEDEVKHMVIVEHLNLNTIDQTALTSEGQVYPSYLFGGNMTIRVRPEAFACIHCPS